MASGLYGHADTEMPVFPNPFTLPGTWYRGNLHCHTTESDGAMPPDRLVAHYSYAGWDFLSITDHWKRTVFPEGTALPDITLIPGIEIGTAPASTLAGTNYHIVGIGVEAELPKPTGRIADLSGPGQAQWYIDAIREQGGIAHVAHAYWSGLRLADVELLRGTYAMEIYNADTEVHIGRGNSQVLLDDLLTLRIPTSAIAVDDCHRPGYDSLRAWTVVRAPNRSPQSILTALRLGHFYCSSGPEILDVRWEPAGNRNGVPYGGVVTVRCSAARSVALVANATRGSRLNAGPFGMASRATRLRTERNRPEGVIDGELLTGAQFELQGNETYARIQVEDTLGRCAWTNPLFVRTAEEEG
jgi:hypothetical protein